MKHRMEIAGETIGRKHHLRKVARVNNERGGERGVELENEEESIQDVEERKKLLKWNE
jgi:hypothetical protein